MWVQQKDQAAVASAIPTAGDVDGRDRMAPSRMIPRVCWGFEDLILREMLLMAEILHQLIWKLSHYLQGFIHPWWWRISSINRYKLMGCILSLEGLESKLFDILNETSLSKYFSGFILNFGGLVDPCRFTKHAACRGSFSKHFKMVRDIMVWKTIVSTVVQYFYGVKVNIAVGALFLVQFPMLLKFIR